MSSKRKKNDDLDMRYPNYLENQARLFGILFMLRVAAACFTSFRLLNISDCLLLLFFNYILMFIKDRICFHFPRCLPSFSDIAD